MIVANCNSQLRTVRFAMVDGGIQYHILGTVQA